MSYSQRFRNIGRELKSHAPFTFLGAVIGLLCMYAARDICYENSLRLFRVFHPLHVVLSAMVTAAVYRTFDRKKHFLTVLVIGYFGSIGVATLSDSIIPFFGESILGVAMPAHAHLHEAIHENSAEANEGEHASEKAVCGHEECEHDGGHGVLERLHLGFIEEWYSVTPAALLGVFIAYFLPKSKFPHAAHVLISTWASSAHILMNMDYSFSITLAIGFLIVLFVSVWLPCCISDIIFPLLFINDAELREKLKHTH